MWFSLLYTQWQSRNFLKTNTPRPLRISTRCLKTELSTHTTCYLERYLTTHRSSEPRRQIADDLRAPPCPTQPGRGPAHLSNHPPAHLSNHHHLRPAPTPLESSWPPRPFAPPPTSRVHACVCSSLSSSARARGRLRETVRAPRTRAHKRAR